MIQYELHNKLSNSSCECRELKVILKIQRFVCDLQSQLTRQLKHRRCVHRHSTIHIVEARANQQLKGLFTFSVTQNQTRCTLIVSQTQHTSHQTAQHTPSSEQLAVPFILSYDSCSQVEFMKIQGWQRAQPTFYNLRGLLDERQGDVTVTIHGHCSDEQDKNYKLHRVILAGETRVRKKFH